MIRDERPEDRDAISALTTAAFLGKAYAGGNEAQIIEALRTADALALSLVHDEGSTVIGHVAASPAIVGGVAGWFALGPISVRPDKQGTGIGSGLMRAALARLTDKQGVVLAGDPAFYTRFGFSRFADLSSRGIPAEYLLAHPFGGSVPSGEIAFHDAFAPQ